MTNNLDFEEQLKLLESRGMIIPEKERKSSINKLKTVSYYRIKEFAKPFEVINDAHKSINRTIFYLGLN